MHIVRPILVLLTVLLALACSAADAVSRPATLSKSSSYSYKVVRPEAQIAVRLRKTLEHLQPHPGDTFVGVMARPWQDTDGSLLIPSGAKVSGYVLPVSTGPDAVPTRYLLQLRRIIDKRHIYDLQSRLLVCYSPTNEEGCNGRDAVTVTPGTKILFFTLRGPITITVRRMK